jgi:hypothetical protein
VVERDAQFDEGSFTVGRDALKSASLELLGDSEAAAPVPSQVPGTAAEMGGLRDRAAVNVVPLPPAPMAQQQAAVQPVQPVQPVQQAVQPPQQQAPVAAVSVPEQAQEAPQVQQAPPAAASAAPRQVAPSGRPQRVCKPIDRLGWNPISAVDDDTFDAILAQHASACAEHSEHAARLQRRVAVANAAAFDAVTPADVPEPDTFDQAVTSAQRNEWRRAMDAELASQREHKTWNVVSRSAVPSSKRVLQSRWVFKLKRDANGNVARYKARVVVKGCAQRPGVDYEETFAPVMSQRTLRVLLSLAAARDLEAKQVDVETAFLHAAVEEEIYMELPPGYGEPGKVARLRKAVYGLRQGPRCWNRALDGVIKQMGFTRSALDPCIYMKGSIILGVFVDDILALYPRAHEPQWRAALTAMSKSFKIKDLGDAQHVLGWRITRERTRRMLFVDQAAYVRRVAHRFGAFKERAPMVPMATRPMPARSNDVVTEKPYAELIGSLQYVATSTRPDVAFSVGALAQHLQRATDEHWAAAMKVLRFLLHTADERLVFGGSASVQPRVYTDADFAGDTADRKSVSGVIVTVGDGAPVVWMSRKQREVAQSSMESEYIALAEAMKDALWVSRLLVELRVTPRAEAGAVPVFVDNKALLPYSKGEAVSQRTRHIATRYHFVRDCVEKKEVKLVWVQARDQLADLLTKPLAGSEFHRTRKLFLV